MNENHGNIDAIIQARLSSTRLPNKILKSLGGKTLLENVIIRTAAAKNISRVIIATTTNPADDFLCEFLKQRSILFHRGSEENVLNRFYETAKKFEVQNICRITPDDPFKDPDVVDDVCKLYKSKKLDFAYNNLPVSFPEGLDVEVFSFDALEKANNNSKSEFEREHITQYFFNNLSKLRHENLKKSGKNLSYLRWTIDYPEDFEMAQIVYEKLGCDNKIFKMNEILNFLENNKDITQINSKVKRSYHYK